MMIISYYLYITIKFVLITINVFRVQNILTFDKTAIACTSTPKPVSKSDAILSSLVGLEIISYLSSTIPSFLLSDS